jgi:hypothetical protein
MSSWTFASLSLSLSLSVGHPRKLQITIIRSVMFSSSCYHLPSDYGTRSGDRSDVKKGTARLTDYTPFYKHSKGILTVAAEIHWRNDYTVDGDNAVGKATRYGLDGRGIESLWGARFSALVQIGPGNHSASKAKNTGFFQGVQRPELCLDHPPRQAPKLKKE